MFPVFLQVIQKPVIRYVLQFNWLVSIELQEQRKCKILVKHWLETSLTHFFSMFSFHATGKQKTSGFQIFSEKEHLEEGWNSKPL